MAFAVPLGVYLSYEYSTSARSTFLFLAKIGGWRGRSADEEVWGCVVPRQQKPRYKDKKWSDEVAILPRSTGAAGYLGSGRSLGG